MTVKICATAMSLSDLGKNDISAQVQGFKDKLASQGTLNVVVTLSTVLMTHQMGRM